MRVVSQSEPVIEAYVSEQQVAAISPGQAVRFLPASARPAGDRGRSRGGRQVAAEGAARPLLASIYGGDIVVKQGQHGALVAQDAVFRVTVKPLGGVAEGRRRDPRQRADRDQLPIRRRELRLSHPFGPDQGERHLTTRRLRKTMAKNIQAFASPRQQAEDAARRPTPHAHDRPRAAHAVRRRARHRPRHQGHGGRPRRTLPRPAPLRRTTLLRPALSPRGMPIRPRRPRPRTALPPSSPSRRPLSRPARRRRRRTHCRSRVPKRSMLRASRSSRRNRCSSTPG